MVKEFQKCPKEDKPSTSKISLTLPTHIQRPIDTAAFKVKSLHDFENLLDRKLSGLSSKLISNDFSESNIDKI